jgi:hypothetical protein
MTVRRSISVTTFRPSIVAYVACTLSPSRSTAPAGGVQEGRVQMEFLTTPAEDTPEGRLLLNVSGVGAEFEREKVKERTLRGKREKARRGLVVASYPYGYKPDPARPGKLLVHNREAEVIQLIYRLCIEEGRSLERIVVELRRLGAPARKGQWGTTQVARILTSERYIGRVFYGQEQVVPGGRLRPHRHQRPGHRHSRAPRCCPSPAREEPGHPRRSPGELHLPAVRSASVWRPLLSLRLGPFSRPPLLPAPFATSSPLFAAGGPGCRRRRPRPRYGRPSPKPYRSPRRSVKQRSGMRTAGGPAVRDLVRERVFERVLDLGE